MVLAKEDYADDADSILLKLIKAKDWNSVLALLSNNNNDDNNNNTAREAQQQKDHHHHQQQQHLVSVPDVYGNLPLHVIIGYQGPEDLILRILYMYPTAVTVHGTDEWLPLHVAAMWGASSKVMEALIRLYPQGLDDKGEEGGGGLKGRTPRHFALRWPHNRHLLERSTADWIQLIESDKREGLDQQDHHHHQQHQPSAEESVETPTTKRMKASSSYTTCLLLNSQQV